ncbi:acid beta-fructofuranosidase 2, vacuolar-like [Malania oleifera]|uniref:acid beta-fructofuranosidase 2, vacuolar-like n=1 Tax=Malania oleifera TaxID=397392 RepID=UPI0025AE00D3|nr:acid beta-fructofuranosidase 2, vacuolar-like [Malania oleifera]
MAATFSDPENLAPVQCSYAPLPEFSDGAGQPGPTSPGRRLTKQIALYVCSGLLLFGLVQAILYGLPSAPSSGVYVAQESSASPALGAVLRPASRGPSAGVSEKTFRLKSGLLRGYPWSSDLLFWQRTAFHFQPEKNWMNGPMFYKGWYHFFYQYNPDAAVWGNIVWGHAVSKDLINWIHLPLAMVADQWYDVNGVWTGSATILPNGELVMLYTGSTNESVQVQNLAYPADPNDPLLINWVKYSGNPILVPPPGIDVKDFRDPTTAWYTPDGKWRIAIGSKVNKTGISLLYDTEDFKSFEFVDEVLHAVNGTGMWECVDFYPVSEIGKKGLDTSVNGPGVKYVLKASLDDDKNDYYALGTYIHAMSKWTPDDAKNDVGIGLRYDYGKFYASKTFYDQNKERRVLWGWIMEADSENADVQKGWASLQAIPRTILFDKRTGGNIIQWPVEEIKSLRTSVKKFNKVKVGPGSVMPLDVGTATQLDIMAEFEVDKKALKRIAGADAGYSCSASGGAAQRGALGPFGLLVLADGALSEQTPVYFYVAKGADSNLKTFFCADESRSSKATDVDKGIYGSTVPVLEGEKLSVRILVDHSILESFAQGGRTCITSRVYPTRAIHGAARLFLFNNATEAHVTASLKIWQMNSATTQSNTHVM